MLTLSFALAALVSTSAQDPAQVDWGTTLNHHPGAPSFSFIPDYPTAMVAAGDNANIVVGQYLPGNSTSTAAWFVDKVDRDGQVVWSRDSGITIDETIKITDAVSDGEGGVVFVGTHSYRLSPFSDDIFIQRLDQDGNTVWESGIGDSVAETASSDAVQQRAASIAPDGAGGYWVGGKSVGTTAGYIASLFKFDSVGQLVASYAFPVSLSSLGLDFLDLEPDGAGGVFCLVPQGFQTPATRQSILHLGPLGELIWHRELTGPFFSANAPFESLVLTSDGGLVASAGAGTRGPLVNDLSFGTTAEDKSLFVKVAQSDGSIVLTNSITFDTRSFVTEMASTSDGGVFVTGLLSPNAQGPSIDAFFARLDSACQPVWVQNFRAADAGLTGGTFVESSGAIRADRFGFVVAGMTTPFNGSAGDSQAHVVRYVEAVGDVYCDPAVANSTGFPARLLAEGSIIASDNELVISAAGLPSSAACLLFNSPTQAFFPGLAGGQGTLCMGGPFGRYINSAQVSNAVGRATYPLNLKLTPTPTGVVQTVAGDVWNFQVWYRDANPGTTSNLTDAVSITFQ